MNDINDIYLKDLINAIRTVEGGQEYVKNFRETGGFINNCENPIQKAITEEWSKTSLYEQSRCSYACLFRQAQQFFNKHI